ncbi:hypothetical protein [Pseudomonas veronii]|uniref:hypothetical protein n=1 Tax=Pseudomonas veronii TaxID=76761 RepID=UPI000F82D96F|nr:hypothetical protein [Pseudomonas veronii]RTY75545.1 hypothetical protein EKA83_15765 [Pseudomonas veronii]
MNQSHHAYCDVALAINQRRNMALALCLGLVGSNAPKASPMFRVIPAGNEFFHVVDSTTGKVKGFRRDHNEACALAQRLETRHANQLRG